jgi:hypothetical protein
VAAQGADDPDLAGGEAAAPAPGDGEQAPVVEGDGDVQMQG